MAANAESGSSDSDIFTSFVVQIKDYLDDDTLQRMGAVLTASGRGRPPKLVSRPLTARLLLQLELLRIESKKTWADVVELYKKATENDPLQGLSLYNEVQALVKKAKQVKEGGGDLEALLSTDIGACIMEKNVGPHLLKYKIYRQHLVNPELLKTLTNKPELTNGLVVDLLHFYQHHTPKSWLIECRKALENLGASMLNLSDIQVNSRLKKFKDRQTSLMKSVRRPTGQQNMNLFLSASFDLDAPTPPVMHLPAQFTAEDRAQSAMTCKLAALRREMQETKNELEAEKENNKVLKELCTEKNSIIETANSKISDSKTQIAKMQNEKKHLSQCLIQAKSTIKEIRSTNFYKRLKRKERHMKKREAAQQVENCERQMMRLKRKLKLRG